MAKVAPKVAPTVAARTDRMVLMRNERCSTRASFVFMDSPKMFERACHRARDFSRKAPA
jgi:hypothetical protein